MALPGDQTTQERKPRNSRIMLAAVGIALTLVVAILLNGTKILGVDGGGDGGISLPAIPDFDGTPGEYVVVNPDAQPQNEGERVWEGIFVKKYSQDEQGPNLHLALLDQTCTVFEGSFVDSYTPEELEDWNSKLEERGGYIKFVGGPDDADEYVSEVIAYGDKEYAKSWIKNNAKSETCPYPE